MLEWTCVSPQIIVAVSIPLACFFLVFYAFLVSSPLDKKSQGTTFRGVQYSALHDQRMSQEARELNISENFITAWNIYMPMIYLFLQYFADDLSIQVLAAPLAYPQRALYPMGRFTYYALAHNIGMLIGRAYLLVVSITCSSAIRHVQIKSTWIFAAAGNALMFLFVFAAWFRFLREVGVILVMCFLVGLVTGSNYANSALLVHQQTTDVSRREFALGLLTLGSSAGSYASGLLGLFLKPYLTTHCLFELGLGNNCFPKFAYFFSWEKNVRCY